MQMGDVVFYALGAAFVAGVSGIVDFNGMFAGASGSEFGDEDDDASSRAALLAQEAEAYQSTLAYFLDEGPDSLLDLRQSDAPAEALPDILDQVAPLPDPLASATQALDDDNIFEDVGEPFVLDDEYLVEPEQQANEVEVFDLPDPESDPAWIDDFDTLRDHLTVEFLPEIDPETGRIHIPELTLAYDAEAGINEILLDGAAVAEVEGPELDEADIDLAPMSDLA